MRTEINVGLIDFLLIISVFQSIFVAFFIFKNTKYNRKANFYQGVFLLATAVLVFESFLNSTGYITRMLKLTQISQPLNFYLGPFLYFYTYYSLYPQGNKKGWYHFIFPVFWSVYIIFFITQPDVLKYNCYVSSEHPDWASLPITWDLYWADPLFLKPYCNLLTIASFFLYDLAILFLIQRKLKSINQSFFKVKHPQIAMIRNSFIHCLVIAILFASLRIIYGMNAGIGQVVVLYYCFFILMLSFRVINQSNYFSQPYSLMDFPVVKYQKSSLSDVQKDIIHKKIRREMEESYYFTSNLASLSGLAKKLGYSTHHISQVINEQMGLNFFELLSNYRIEYAISLMKQDDNRGMTLEEISEKVGYNSKSTFNSAFKKTMKVTPSEYRKMLSV